MRAIGLFLLFILGLVWIVLHPSRAPDHVPLATMKVESGTGTTLSPATSGASGSTQPTSSAAPVAALPTASQSRADALRSLESRTLLLSEAMRAGQDMKFVLRELVKNSEEPVVASQRNSLTGDLTTIRSDRPLPGTRYFHAQYFGSESEAFLQHMSFEFEPSATAMTDAVSAIERSFGVSRTHAERHGGSLHWATGDGYVVSVKRLESSDLGPNPYNAYTQDDVGTVQVTVELDQSENEG